MEILWKVVGAALLVVGAIIAFKIITSLLLFIITVGAAGALIYGGYRLLTR